MAHADTELEVTLKTQVKENWVYSAGVGLYSDFWLNSPYNYSGGTWYIVHAARTKTFETN